MSVIHYSFNSNKLSLGTDSFFFFSFHSLLIINESVFRNNLKNYLIFICFHSLQNAKLNFLLLYESLVIFLIFLTDNIDTKINLQCCISSYLNNCKCACIGVYPWQVSHVGEPHQGTCTIRSHIFSVVIKHLEAGMIKVSRWSIVLAWKCEACKYVLADCCLLFILSTG